VSHWSRLTGWCVPPSLFRGCCRLDTQDRLGVIGSEGNPARRHLSQADFLFAGPAPLNLRPSKFKNPAEQPAQPQRLLAATTWPLAGAVSSTSLINTALRVVPPQQTVIEGRRHSATTTSPGCGAAKGSSCRRSSVQVDLHVHVSLGHHPPHCQRYYGPPYTTPNDSGVNTTCPMFWQMTRNPSLLLIKVKSNYCGKEVEEQTVRIASIVLFIQ
jgi:hypothetical protein